MSRRAGREQNGPATDAPGARLSAAFARASPAAAIDCMTSAGAAKTASSASVRASHCPLAGTWMSSSLTRSLRSSVTVVDCGVPLSSRPLRRTRSHVSCAVAVSDEIDVTWVERRQTSVAASESGWPVRAAPRSLQGEMVTHPDACGLPAPADCEAQPRGGPSACTRKRPKLTTGSLMSGGV